MKSSLSIQYWVILGDLTTLKGHKKISAHCILSDKASVSQHGLFSSCPFSIQPGGVDFIRNVMTFPMVNGTSFSRLSEKEDNLVMHAQFFVDFSSWVSRIFLLNGSCFEIEQFSDFQGILKQNICICPFFNSSKMFGQMESVPNMVEAAVCC